MAVITGAGRGLGRAHALLLASKGAKVVVNDPGGNIPGYGADSRPAEKWCRRSGPPEVKPSRVPSPSPAFPLMCKARYARIASSIGGLYGNKLVANYCASKAGLIGLSNAAAVEGAWSHQSWGGLHTNPACITGEMLISAAGRVAKAFVAETRSVFRPAWTVEQLAEKLPSIRDTRDPWILSPVPSGFMEHLGRSFEIAKNSR